MSNSPKINPALLAAIVEAVKASLDKQPAKQAKAAKPNLRDQRKAELDKLTIAAFTAKGFKSVQPRVNVLTAKLWAEKGKTVKAGQEPVWVKAPWMTAKQMGYPMFHASQVA